MNEKELRELLEQVRAGRLSVDAAAGRLEDAPLADLGYAQVDLHRRDRCGFPEVIFCEGKNREWVEGVVRKLVDAGQDCLATRVHAELSEHLARVFPQAKQDVVARTFWLPAGQSPHVRAKSGRVCVLTAGTSDLQGADAIVAVAGMDGALPSVVGGLVDCPVVAVPTSVGYGAAFQGIAPLLTMLNSCSANVVVVNIDSGFKGGYVAALIARRRFA